MENLMIGLRDFKKCDTCKVFYRGEVCPMCRLKSEIVNHRKAKKEKIEQIKRKNRPTLS